MSGWRSIRRKVEISTKPRHIVRGAKVLSNMGCGALNSHAGGKGHKDLVKKFRCFFNKPSGSKGKDTSDVVEVVNNTTTDVVAANVAQPTLDLYIQNKAVIEAEIRWILHAVITGQSDNSNDKGRLTNQFSLKKRPLDVLSFTPSLPMKNVQSQNADKSMKNT